VVIAAHAFLAALTTAQQATANIAFTQQAAETWTNLPGGNRNGVEIEDMSAAAQAAALTLAQTALSEAGNTELENIRNADSVIASTTSGNSGWGAGLTHFAVLGTPSTTAVWMLQICAHHLVYNIVYNGNMVSATPVFLGTEPPNWTLLPDGGTLVTGNANGSTVYFVNGTETTTAVDTDGGTGMGMMP
jgi:DNA-binding beta-propeller fold protein YncE